jgi:magnesium transporter
MVKWTEVLSQNVEQLNLLGRELKVHPLALEDCQHRDQRPKLDDYETHQLLVWFLLAANEVHEIQFIIYPDHLVAIPHDPPPHGATWWEFLRMTDPGKDVWHLLYHALDRITDISWQEMRKMFADADEYEQEMFRREISPQDLIALKRQINEVDYSLSHLPSVTEQLQNLCQPTGDLAWKLRDLHDHCERIYRTISLYRSQIATTIELYWGLQANRTNAQVKKLSLLASIAVPMTFWASFWGMNFQAIPFDSPHLFWSAIGVMGISVLLTTWLLIRKGYWAD